MAFEDVLIPELWAIRHKPSGKLLRMNLYGYGHTKLNVEIEDGRAHQNHTTVPRLYHARIDAERSLTQWLRGCHSNDWEDGLSVYTPTVPRIKEDMEVIRIHFITEVIDDTPDY